jgi:WD40 repeat protein
VKDPVVFEAHSSYVLGLSFSKDSRVLISSGMDNLVKLWAVPDWTLVRTLEGHAKSVNAIDLSPDGRTLATGSSDTTVKLWSFPDGVLFRTLQDRKRTVSTVRISPDGAWVGAGFYGGRAMVWTLSGEEVVGIRTSTKNLSSIAFSYDSQTLATSGLGDDILLWSLPSGEKIGTLSGHQIAVMNLAFIHAGRQLVSQGHEGSIKFWNSDSWQETRTVCPDGSGLRGLAFSPDEETLALSLESQVQLWSVQDWRLISKLPVGTKVINGMAFSPDGRWLAAGAADKNIRIWDLRPG